MTKRLSAADITAMTANATHRVIEAKSPSEIKDVSAIALDVFDVDFYDKNPRQHRNPLFDEIKTSIEARGLESSLFVTKRPGAQRYMLARGGNTRLEVLRELAGTDPKWRKLTFFEVPWSCESEVLAAHLVENTSRSDLCFFDQAQGLTAIKDQLQVERGRPISGREFPELLKDRGINVGHTVLRSCEFVMEFFPTLDAWRADIKMDHVHSKIRPALNTLRDCWLLKPGESEDSFVTLVRGAVASEADGQPYSPELLVDLVLESVANGLDVQPQALEWALNNGTAQWPTLEALKSTLGGDGSATNDNSQGQGQGQGAGAFEQNPSGQFIAGGGNTALQNSITKAAQRRTDVPGIPGVTVRRGLVPIAPTPQTGTNTTTGAGGLPHGVHGGPLNQEELALLEAEGPQGLAERVFRSELNSMATLAGIEDLVTASASPYLPYRFYLEIPQPGKLGASSDDIAVQAWWLLSGISGQADKEVIPYLLDPETSMAGGACALQDTGPGCYHYVLSHPEVLQDAIVNCLGGESLPLFELMVQVLTDQVHPLHEPLIQVLDACANWNTARRSS